ncbi:hypothetical protein PHLGIDRAFT_425005 [Phlebiopsis gigantea 11061_1 CR5-6]|uniref:DUF7918 domain-containing protein n=1 Tax=Phlebiopsis gigantea (strain 11061_1 CR5-6) TaxID=745531 RepID=A0A0C3PLE5_PHLG1|nr:hypothetical protein PHLGIDRAFT_425005 [Phlebiopsis gigantea 11061_1 CR5-6]
MKHGDIELSVKIGDDRLEEYDTVIEDNEATCWIASEEGKNFTILYINTSQHQDMKCCVEIDGRDAEPSLLPHRCRALERGVSTGPDTVLPYAFSRIQLSDDDALRDQYARQSVEQLGSIRIAVHRIKIGEVVVGKPWPTRAVPQAIGPVHERMKKGGAHCVSLGEQVKTKPQNRYTYTALDDANKPHCVFTFRYRSKDILQAQGIIPLIASPRVPPPDTLLPPDALGEADTAASKKRPRHDSVKEDSEDEDNEDEKALQAQVAAAVAQLQHIEAKMAKMKDKKRQKRVKREVSPIQIAGGSGGIIDLTSD